MRREIIGSELWNKPPIYSRTFEWLQSRPEYDSPSLRDIAAGVSWWENRQLRTPAARQISEVLRYLVEIGWVEWEANQGRKGRIRVVPVSAYMPSTEAIRCVERWHRDRPLPAADDERFHKVFDDLHDQHKVEWERIGQLVLVVLEHLHRLKVPTQLMGQSKSRPELRVWQTLLDNMGAITKTTDGQTIDHEDATTITLKSGEVRIKK